MTLDDRVIRSLDDLRRLAPDAPLCPCPDCGAHVPFFHQVDDAGVVLRCHASPAPLELELELELEHV